MSEEWPYDAAKDDPLVALRIPVVPTYFPHWAYFVAVCINDDQTWRGLRPTDAEAAMLASLIQYLRSEYRPHYVTSVLDTKPFDLDGGINTLTFVKRAEGDWCYRRQTWQYGPTLFPVPEWMRREDPTAVGPFNLRQLLDHIKTYGDHIYAPWARWTAEHPDVFLSEEQVTTP